ncbi:MAG: class I SAM-dependent methyltransferase [Candidatus Limnocylindrales bacterium]
MTTERRPPSTGDPPSPAQRPSFGRSADPAVRHSTASFADPSALGGSAPLISRIRAEIEASPERRITFARYMERALYEPGLGYYSVIADRPTDRGDFLTAPETHAIFGWTIARRIEAIWDELHRPRPFALVEYGAGSGTLGLSIFNGLRRHGSVDLLDAIRYEPVESNPNRLADLRRRFDEAGLAGHVVERLDDRQVDRPVEGSAASTPTATSTPIGAAWRTAPNEVVPVTGVILANEFIDAIPVHRVVVRGGTLLELCVAWSGEGSEGSGGFAESAAEPSTPELAARLADDGVVLAEGQVAEICLGLDPWLRGVAARLEHGYLLAIDYGYEATELYGPRHLAGSLLGYRGHRVEPDPFAAPGQVDLTAHVDFTAVARLATDQGLRTVSLTTQSEFLVAAGLEEELRALQSSPELTLADYTRARSGIVRMLDPRHMGRFRVLTLARDAGS